MGSGCAANALLFEGDRDSVILQLSAVILNCLEKLGIGGNLCDVLQQNIIKSVICSVTQISKNHFKMMSWKHSGASGAQVGFWDAKRNCGLCFFCASRRPFGDFWSQFLGFRRGSQDLTFS